jgi:hypothetical protein
VRFSSTYKYNAVVTNSQIEIKIPLKNPLAGAPTILRGFRVRTYYIKDTGYYYMNGDSGLVNHVPACTVLATPAVTNIFWPEMFHQTERTRTA